MIQVKRKQRRYGANIDYSERILGGIEKGDLTQHPSDALAAIVRGQTKEREMGVNKIIAQSGRIAAISGAVGQGMRLIDWAKPVLIWAGILFLAMGPGLLVVSTLLETITWYWWIIAIFAGTYIWRNY